MLLDEVPQDKDSAHVGHKKLMYAVDTKGKYVPTGSLGWEAETFATRLAVKELEQQAEIAKTEWQQGLVSPLKYLMYQHRLDITSLAQASGFWKWRINRHFKPKVFAKLSPKLLARYAEVLGLEVRELSQLQASLL